MRAYVGNITLSGVTAPGIIVEFDKPWRLILWSRAQYVPCWDLGLYCYEPIMDKKNKYIKAKI